MNEKRLEIIKEVAALYGATVTENSPESGIFIETHSSTHKLDLDCLLSELMIDDDANCFKICKNCMLAA